MLGSLIGDCAEVSLKAPPPIETPLEIAESDGEWTLSNGDRVIAVGHAAELDLDVPAPPDYEAAKAAEARYAGHDNHIFPSCFVCGPDRDEHDGLRLFAGRDGDREVAATHWHPEQDVAGEFGAVSARIVWAALDCPTYFGALVARDLEVAVLGRLTAKLLRPVEIGRDHVVIGWPIDDEGRKFTGGSAIYTADGELCAYAKGVWVRIDANHAGFKVAD